MYIELHKLNYNERVIVPDYYNYDTIKKALVDRLDNSEGYSVGTHLKLYARKDKYVTINISDEQFNSLVGKDLLEALEISKVVEEDVPWT